MLKIRLSRDRLNFNRGIQYLEKTVFILRQGPVGHTAWQPMLANCNLIKFLFLISRLGTHKSHLRVLNFKWMAVTLLQDSSPNTGHQSEAPYEDICVQYLLFVRLGEVLFVSSFSNEPVEWISYLFQLCS